MQEVTRSHVTGVKVAELQYPVRCFVCGDTWTWFFSLVESDLHLFGVDNLVCQYVLGTDEQGRNMLLRLIHGAWISLFIGVISVFIGVAVGVTSPASSAGPPTCWSSASSTPCWRFPASCW